MLNNGFEIIPKLISPDRVKRLSLALEHVVLKAQSGGIRHAEKKFPAIRELVSSPEIITLAQQYLAGTSAIAPAVVRVIYFNKTPDNNWLVSWHQDRTVAVSAIFKDERWGPWSVKEGVHHVQPPEDVLKKMVTLRVHLDDANENNGCLHVIPKSHNWGLLSQANIQQHVKARTAVSCELKAGSVLVMRPLILHSSRKALQPTSRRVIHIEFSRYRLPSGVFWA